MNDDNSNGKIAKLLIDGNSDFRLQVAYSAYSKAWVENPDEGRRIELNKIMQSLVENKEDYPAFYDRINQYMKNMSNDYSDRSSFKAQNKRAWRRSEAKENRISRHRK